MKTRIKVTSLTYDYIVTILSVGLSGSEWAVVDNGTPYYNRMEAKALNDDCIEDILAKILLNGEPIHIIDSYENKTHSISLIRFKQGLEKYFNNGGNCDIEEWDFYDGDEALQYIVLGEVIYG